MATYIVSRPVVITAAASPYSFLNGNIVPRPVVIKAAASPYSFLNSKGWRHWKDPELWELKNGYF